MSLAEPKKEQTRAEAKIIKEFNRLIPLDLAQDEAVRINEALGIRFATQLLAIETLEASAIDPAARLEQLEAVYKDMHATVHLAMALVRKSQRKLGAWRLRFGLSVLALQLGSNMGTQMAQSDGFRGNAPEYVGFAAGLVSYIIAETAMDLLSVTKPKRAPVAFSQALRNGVQDLYRNDVVSAFFEPLRKSGAQSLSGKVPIFRKQKWLFSELEKIRSKTDCSHLLGDYDLENARSIAQSVGLELRSI